jgi:hypothetical protein
LTKIGGAIAKTSSGGRAARLLIELHVRVDNDFRKLF